MKGDNKNQNAVFLMVVGVIFIVIAGAIFVTTAWQQLPVIGKQIILLGTAVGLFAGSGKAYQSKKMRKTESALFYLAAAFSGFFVLSLLSNVSGVQGKNVIIPNAFNLMMAELVMMVPIFLRFVKTRKGMDFGAFIVLLDGVIFWFTAAFERPYEWDVKMYSFLQAGVILLFAIGDYYRQKWLEDNRGLDIWFSIIYLLHGIGYVCFTGFESLDGFLGKGQRFALLVVLVIATLLTYVSRKRTVYRVFNSLSILWCVFAGVDFVNSLLPETVKMSAWGILFTAYMVNLAIMVCTLRKEMFYTLLSFEMLVPFAQLISYGGFYFLFSYIPHTPAIYIPFTPCMMIAMVMFVKRRVEKGEITWEEGKRFINGAGVQGITVLMMLQAAVMEGFLMMGTCVLVMVSFLTAAVLHKKNNAVKNILFTFALGMGELAAFSQPYVEISSTYNVEWVCFVLGIGNILLHLIWNNKKTNNMRVVSFVFTCILLAVLLINDMIQGGLGNVIILGVAGVVMLLVAAIFNRREYVIAASAALILLVLYITRSFWLSIAWWVYLFAAGVVLILLAIKKESTEK